MAYPNLHGGRNLLYDVANALDAYNTDFSAVISVQFRAYW
jgi:hypothetical protein